MVVDYSSYDIATYIDKRKEIKRKEKEKKKVNNIILI